MIFSKGGLDPTPKPFLNPAHDNVVTKANLAPATAEGG